MYRVRAVPGQQCSQKALLLRIPPSQCQHQEHADSETSAASNEPVHTLQGGTTQKEIPPPQQLSENPPSQPNNQRPPNSLAAHDDQKNLQPEFLSVEAAPEPMRNLHGSPHRAPSSSSGLTEHVIAAIVPDWKKRVTPDDFAAIKWSFQSDPLWMVGKMDKIEGKTACANWLPLQSLNGTCEAVSPCNESRVAVHRPDGRSVFDRVLENDATIQSPCPVPWSEQSPLPQLHPKVLPLRRKVLTDAAILLAKKLPAGVWDNFKLDNCDLASFGGSDDQSCDIAKDCIRQAYQSLHVETEKKRVCATTGNAQISVQVMRTMLGLNTLASTPSKTTPAPAAHTCTPSHPPTRGQGESKIDFLLRRFDHLETVDQRNLAMIWLGSHAPPPWPGSCTNPTPLSVHCKVADPPADGNCLFKILRFLESADANRDPKFHLIHSFTCSNIKVFDVIKQMFVFNGIQLRSALGPASSFCSSFFDAPDSFKTKVLLGGPSDDPNVDRCADMAFRKFLLRVEALRRQNFAASVIASQ
eukprot:jgi/Bigna1/73572/fgenesh1_pg.25_\